MPNVFVESIGQDVSYPDEWSAEQITRHAQENFPAPPQELGVVGGTVRAARNIAGSVVESAAAIPETVAVIAGKLAREFPSLGEDRPFAELPTHRLADWIRYQAEQLYPDPAARPDGVTGFLTDTLPQGAGSMGAMIAGGAALGALKIPAALGTAAIGAAVNGASAFQEAVKAGADDETAWKVFMLNAGVGTTEAVPIAKWLTRNPVVGSKIKHAIVDGAGELTQEAFQQIFQNAVAQGTYDPERPWLQGAPEAGAAGFTLGTLASLVFSAVGGKKVAVSTAAQRAKEAGAPATAAALEVAKPPAPTVTPVEPKKDGEGQATVKKVPPPEKPVTHSAAEESIVEAQTNPEEPAAATPPIPGVLTFEGNPVTTESRADVRHAARIIEEVNAELGPVISKIVIQDLDETSAGIASAPRAGAFDTVVIDPIRLGDSISNGLDLKEAVMQEVTHNLDGYAVQQQWEAQGKPGTFQSFWDEHHNAIAREMTPEQRAATEQAYGAKIPSDVNMAAEFVHLLLRGDFRGSVDGSSQSALSRFLGFIKGFWERFAGKDSTAVSTIAKDHVARIESILKQRSTPAAPASAPNVEVGKAVQTDAARAAGDVAGEAAAAAEPAGEGSGAAAGPSAGTAGPDAQSGSSDQVIIDAYQKVGEAMDRLQGVTDTERDLARTQVFEGVMKRAVQYQAAKGSMQGFAWQNVIKQQTVNALKALNTKARSPEGGSVSLDAPIGEGEATVADTVAAESAAADRSEAVAATKRLMAGIPQVAQDVLNAAASGDRGWMVKYGKEQGITKQAVLSRLRAAQTLMKQAALKDPAAIEALGFSPEDLINAAPPVTTNYPAWREPKARDLSFRQKLVRFMRPSTWAVPGYLREVARHTNGQTSVELLHRLADGIERYFDKRSELLGYIEQPFFAVTDGLSKEQYDAVKMEVQLWAQTAQARDNGQTLAASWQVAEALLPSLSQPAQAIIAAIKQQGVFSGQIGNQLQVHVRDGATWRLFNDLGEKWWPRRLANHIQEILADPDHFQLTGEFDQLVAQLHAHDPQAFPTMEAAYEWLSENGASSLSNGDFFAGLEMARGDKLPDSWYDYSLDGYMLNLESWANRTAQIDAFGQSLPGLNNPNIPTRDLFDEVTARATSQHNVFGSDSDGLAKRLAIFKDEIMDSNQAKWNDKLGNTLASIATVRYLFSIMTSVRNVAQSFSAIGENLGWYKAFRAGNRGLWSAARAISTSTRMGRLIEPDIVSQAAAAGAIQRSLYLSTTTGIVAPSNSRLGRFVHWAMTPNQMVEQWTRGVNYVAAQLWLRDAADEFNANPHSKASLRMQAQMQRWGLDQMERRAAMSGNATAANKLFRAAVKEKLYGYRQDQVPVIFKSRYGKLLLQFQAWGAQRQRDIARNILGPAFYGETVDGQRIRNPWPLLKFIIGSIAGAALVNGIKQALFDRRERDATWGEMLNAMSDDEKRAMQISINKIFDDLTKTGASGIIPDYLRIMKDGLTPGRQKNFVNAPGLQLAVDITELIKDQIERDGDPSAVLRDVRDRLLRTTPIVREMEDATLGYLLADTDMGKIKAARQNVNVARAKIRAWAKETDRDDVGARRGSQQLKNPNSELYDSIQEALLIGDVSGAGKLINEATNYRVDRKKLNAISASMRGRHPLQLPGMDKADAREFMSWLQKRNPGEYARALETVEMYERTKILVGLK